jgi:hypothetical protein
MTNRFAWIAEHPYAYPLLEIVHIAGIGLLLGSLVTLELRVWGKAAVLDAVALGRLALTVTLAGFGLAAASGLLVLAAGNAAFFHTRGGLQRLDRTARVQTLLSVLLWLAVIACGRWIAYL